MTLFQTPQRLLTWRTRAICKNSFKNTYPTTERPKSSLSRTTALLSQTDAIASILIEPTSQTTSISSLLTESSTRSAATQNVATLRATPLRLQSRWRLQKRNWPPRLPCEWLARNSLAICVCAETTRWSMRKQQVCGWSITMAHSCGSCGKHSRECPIRHMTEVKSVSPSFGLLFRRLWTIRSTSTRLGSRRSANFYSRMEYGTSWPRNGWSLAQSISSCIPCRSQFQRRSPRM